MEKDTVSLSVRVPRSSLADLGRAIEATGALNYSDLIRDAIRSYLANLEDSGESPQAQG